MIEILRVLADGTGTSPIRSARAPVARSFRYQLAWNGTASHNPFSCSTRSCMTFLLRSTAGDKPSRCDSRSALVQPDVPEVHVRSRLEALDVLAAGVEPEVVAETDARGVGVEDGLDLVPHRVALLRVRLASHGLQELILLRV